MLFLLSLFYSYHYSIKVTFSFHCNCFVCSMLDLIYSSSILIDSCRCLPLQKKGKNLIFSSLVKKIIIFLKTKNIEKVPDFPRCSTRGRSWHIKTALTIYVPIKVILLFSVISMHHNGFTKSFACCLSCESCLCAQCQMPGQGRGNVGMGRLWRKGTLHSAKP